MIDRIGSIVMVVVRLNVGGDGSGLMGYLKLMVESMGWCNACLVLD